VLNFVEQARTLLYHAGMLADERRMDAYRDAIHEAVRPGDVVVDLGSGTGVLSFFACQAGAARVYAIERGPTARLGRELCRANGFDDRVTFIEDYSTNVQLPERADALVTETLWDFGVGEGMVGAMADAR
jgi:predicted RNA methylase